jgi:hypothetical protein
MFAPILSRLLFYHKKPMLEQIPAPLEAGLDWSENCPFSLCYQQQVVKRWFSGEKQTYDPGSDFSIQQESRLRQEVNHESPYSG